MDRESLVPAISGSFIKMRLKWVIVAVLLVVFLAPALIGRDAAAPAYAQQGQQTHVVQPGENLFRIALKYGTTWPVLAAANNITNPNLIYVGQVLIIPGPGG
jgi:nucleoid-associated protein YgaU